MKKSNIVYGLLAVALASCGGTAGGEEPYDDDTLFDGTEYYEKVETRAAFDKDYEGNINEHLEGGHLNDAYWNTLEGTWQNDNPSKLHAGMNNRNLFYVHDGNDTYLGFRGRGLYCQDGDLEKMDNGQVKPEGAGIITKEKLIPGRYEIEMAALPRYGGISACWTYLCETGNELTDQNEIDIEIGGHTDGQTFKYFWATSWTTHDNKQTVDQDVSELLYLNDGQFHKYTFDWYTDYLDTNNGRVDWFIDGVLVASVRGSLVTTKEMPLWIGLWFPAWTNNAVFDTDFMLMKSFEFTAFDESQFYEESRANAGYTQTTPSQANIGSIEYSEVKSINKIANGGFDTWSEVPLLSGNHYGWQIREGANKGAVATANVDGSQMLSLTASAEGRAFTFQTLEEFYEGFNYDYSFDAKLADGNSTGKMEVHYLNRLGMDVSSPTVVEIDSTSMKTYSGTLESPEKCVNVEVRFYGGTGTTYVDNVEVTFTGITY